MVYGVYVDGIIVSSISLLLIFINWYDKSWQIEDSISSTFLIWESLWNMNIHQVIRSAIKVYKLTCGSFCLFNQCGHYSRTGNCCVNLNPFKSWKCQSHLPTAWINVIKLWFIMGRIYVMKLKLFLSGHKAPGWHDWQCQMDISQPAGKRLGNCLQFTVHVHEFVSFCEPNCPGWSVKNWRVQ